MNSPAILKAINSVQSALSKEGISKGRKNSQQGYSFRGIDDMYNTMSPLLSDCGIVVLPAYSDRQVVERETKNGGALFYVTLKGDFTFRSSEDGSEVKVTTYGEAMDSGDKATNKAMSAALKYAFMQTFTIPTEGDNDSETQTHEVRANTNPLTQMKQDALNALPIDRRESIRRIGADLSALLSEGGRDLEAGKIADDLSMEEQLALSSIMSAADRSKLKAAIREVRAAAKAAA